VRQKNKGNAAGKLLEAQTISCIVENGAVPAFTFQQFSKLKKDTWPAVFIVRDVPIDRLWYVCGYGETEKCKTEYVLFMKPDGFPNHVRVRVECKHQDTSGSSIDKMLSAIMDLKYCSPPEEDYGILVLDGREFLNRIDSIKNMISLKMDFSALKDVYPFRLPKRTTPATVYVYTLSELKRFIKRVWGKK
jgi:hypothetical protein